MLSEVLFWFLVGLVGLGFILAGFYRAEMAYRRMAVKIFGVLESNPYVDLTGSAIIKKSGLPVHKIDILFRMERDGYLSGKSSSNPSSTIYYEQVMIETRVYSVTTSGWHFYEDAKESLR